LHFILAELGIKRVPTRQGGNHKKESSWHHLHVKPGGIAGTETSVASEAFHCLSEAPKQLKRFLKRCIPQKDCGMESDF